MRFKRLAHICPVCRDADNKPQECDRDGVCPICELRCDIPADDFLRLTAPGPRKKISVTMQFFKDDNWDMATMTMASDSVEELAKKVIAWLTIHERPACKFLDAKLLRRCNLITMEIKHV